MHYCNIITGVGKTHGLQTKSFTFHSDVNDGTFVTRNFTPERENDVQLPLRKWHGLFAPLFQILRPTVLASSLLN